MNEILVHTEKLQRKEDLHCVRIGEDQITL